jgi:DNA-binding transcriptional LysR family regulator
MKARNDELAMFLAIAELGSFRRAAAELRITPSALSHALRAFESRLGVRLVNRTTRSVRLSDAGLRLAERVRPALAAIDDAVAEARDESKSLSGRILITAMEHGAKLLLQHGLARFQRLNPEVEIEVVIEPTLADLVKDGYDAGVRLRDDIPPNMTMIPLAPEVSFVVVASPGYLATHTAPESPKDLLGHRCIRQRFASGAVYRWEFDALGRTVSIDPPGSLISNNSKVIIAAALEGCGVAYVPLHDVRELIASGDLVSLLKGCTPTIGGHCFYYPRAHQQTRAFSALVEDLRREKICL